MRETVIKILQEHSAGYMKECDEVRSDVVRMDGAKKSSWLRGAAGSIDHHLQHPDTGLAHLIRDCTKGQEILIGTFERQGANLTIDGDARVERAYAYFTAFKALAEEAEKGDKSALAGLGEEEISEYIQEKFAEAVTEMETCLMKGIHPPAQKATVRVGNPSSIPMDSTEDTLPQRELGREAGRLRSASESSEGWFEVDGPASTSSKPDGQGSIPMDNTATVPQKELGAEAGRLRSGSESSEEWREVGEPASVSPKPSVSPTLKASSIPMENAGTVPQEESRLLGGIVDFTAAASGEAADSRVSGGTASVAGKTAALAASRERSGRAS